LITADPAVQADRFPAGRCRCPTNAIAGRIRRRPALQDPQVNHVAGARSDATSAPPAKERGAAGDGHISCPNTLRLRAVVRRTGEAGSVRTVRACRFFRPAGIRRLVGALALSAATGATGVSREREMGRACRGRSPNVAGQVPATSSPCATTPVSNGDIKVTKVMTRTRTSCRKQAPTLFESKGARRESSGLRAARVAHRHPNTPETGVMVATQIGH